MWMLGWGLLAVWLSFNIFSVYFFTEPTEELIVASDIILYGSILGGIGTLSFIMWVLKQRYGKTVFTFFNIAAIIGFAVVIIILPHSIGLFLF